MNEVADTEGVADEEPDPEVVVVDDELFELQAAARRPPVSIIVTNARLLLSLKGSPSR